MSETQRVAIIQSTAPPGDLEAGLSKTIHLAQEATQKGAQLVVFGETWLAGYPAWLDHCPEMALWDHGPTKDVFARYRQNSLVVGDDKTQQLQELSGDLEITLAVGISERVEQGPGNRTLYNSFLLFDRGQLVNHHRKLVPTFTERLLWGPGDASGLRAVKTSVGSVGGLICWEHWMPLARQTLHEAGEHIHIALWPTVHEKHQIASRHYAFEGRCFVLAAGQILTAADLPDALPRREGLAPEDLVLRGGSAIIGPDGDYLVEPIFDHEEILIADLDPAAIDREALTLDVSGHYQRPDVFDFQVISRQRQ